MCVECVDLCRFAAKIILNKSLWVVDTFDTAADAGRAHDAAAIGMFGRESLAHLNYPAQQRSFYEVQQAVEKMAVKVRANTYFCMVMHGNACACGPMHLVAHAHAHTRIHTYAYDFNTLVYCCMDDYSW